DEVQRGSRAPPSRVRDALAAHEIGSLNHKSETATHASERPFFSNRKLQFGGGGGGGFESSPTHDERSKKRNSSAVSCCVIGSISGLAVPHSDGNVPLPPPFDTWRSLNTARPHCSVALTGALNDKYAVSYALLLKLALP